MWSNYDLKLHAKGSFCVCVGIGVQTDATTPNSMLGPQGSQIRQIWGILRQNFYDDSTEVTEGVTSTPEIFGNKQGATSTPEIFGNKHSFVLTFFATNTIYVNYKRFKPYLNHQN